MTSSLLTSDNVCYRLRIALNCLSIAPYPPSLALSGRGANFLSNSRSQARMNIRRLALDGRRPVVQRKNSNAWSISSPNSTARRPKAAQRSKSHLSPGAREILMRFTALTPLLFSSFWAQHTRHAALWSVAKLIVMASRHRQRHSCLKPQGTEEGIPPISWHRVIDHTQLLVCQRNRNRETGVFYLC